MRMNALLPALLAAALLSMVTSALAENDSDLKSAILDTAFTMCTGGSESCSDERWRIALDARGWTMQATTRIGTETTDWSETCRDGQYTSDAGDYEWTGTCDVTGEVASEVCFDVAMSSKEANTANTSHQCFQLLAPHICIMRIEGESGPVGAAPDSAERV